MKKKIFTLILIGLLFSSKAFSKAIKVGIIAGPSVEIMDVAKKVAKEKFQLNLEPVIFTNYIMPNEAVHNGDIDINVFQTNSFLKHAIEKKQYKLVSIGNTFIYPMGIYSRKIHKLSELPKKAVIAIPNDASNEGRALSLLAHIGLITLNPKAGEFATIKDILNNPKKLKLVALDASQLPRIVYDAHAILLNNDFIEHAGFHPKDALAIEDPKTSTPYINVIVVKANEKQNKDYQKFVQVMHSKEVLNKNLELYPGAVKAW